MLQVRLADPALDARLRGQLDGKTALWTLEPERFELARLLPAAPLPAGCSLAFDIGTGTGVLAALRSLGVDAHAFDPAERERMMARAKRTSVPQIFIGSAHVGGCDDLMALDSRGGLLPLPCLQVS